MVDLKTLKQLVKLMTDNDLTELDVEGDGERVKLKRGGAGPVVSYAAPGTVTSAAPAGAAAAPASAAAPPAPPAEDEGLETIASPMVGTFYAAATPDAEPFVSAGSRVEPDTVVCLVEAMKVFNEIKAEMTGTIEKVLVGNGDAVEFGQPLFLVKPE